MAYAHTTSRILPTCYLSPGTVTLPAPKAGDFMGLVLLYSMYFLIYCHFHSPFNINFKLRGVNCVSTRTAMYCTLARLPRCVIPAVCPFMCHYSHIK